MGSLILNFLVSAGTATAEQLLWYPEGVHKSDFKILDGYFAGGDLKDFWPHMKFRIGPPTPDSPTPSSWHFMAPSASSRAQY